MVYLPLQTQITIMTNELKNIQTILNKLSIEKLNPMQEQALETIRLQDETILLSPTGSGKTLAFLLPILEMLDKNLLEVQALIVVPTRELAIQIEQVARSMGSGFKINSVYGGRTKSKDKIELKQNPAILIGTPGRILDHFESESFSTDFIQTIVLDEFDKSLEIGFEEEMKSIFENLNHLQRKILTSATFDVEIPRFVGLKNPTHLNFLSKEKNSQLSIKTVISPDKDKLQTLVDLVQYLGNQNGIIFCNFKDSIQTVSDFLTENGIPHGYFQGGMEQKERERALIQFRNGTYKLLIATDLAARGIDIPELKYIIHYELPHFEAEFTHRNGRTARVNEKGTAYVLKWEKGRIADFIDDKEVFDIPNHRTKISQEWETLFISGGRKDKISKGDIAGLFIKQGGLNQDELGLIELKQDCAFVAVPKKKANQLIKNLNNSKLKMKKVRIYVI